MEAGDSVAETVSRPSTQVQPIRLSNSWGVKTTLGACSLALLAAPTLVTGAGLFLVGREFLLPYRFARSQTRLLELASQLPANFPTDLIDILGLIGTGGNPARDYFSENPSIREQWRNEITRVVFILRTSALGNIFGWQGDDLQRILVSAVEQL